MIAFGMIAFGMIAFGMIAFGRMGAEVDMAVTGLPNVKQKQKLLFAKDTSEQILIDHGHKFLSAGWYNDAIDFFERASHAEGLRQIRQTAQDEGDAFLFTRCIRVEGVEVTDDEWHRLADRALELGKLQFAREGYRMAGDRKAMAKVDLKIKPEAEQPVDNGSEA